MTSDALGNALEILRKYHRNPVLITEGKYKYVEVLFDEIEEDDWKELEKLGWEVIDDYVGFEEKNVFNKFFDQWWEDNLQEAYRTIPSAEMDDEMTEVAKHVARTAMIRGVSIGLMDKILSAAAFDAQPETEQCLKK